MRKQAWWCAVLFTCAMIMVMGMSHIEMVPANANVVARLSNLDMRLLEMIDLDTADLKMWISMLGMTGLKPIDQWELLVFGGFGIDPFIFEVLDDLAFLGSDPRPLISLLQQPFGVIGNMVPPLIVHMGVQEIGKELTENEAFFDVTISTIDDLRVIHYQIDHWFDYKPWSLSLYLVLMDEAFLLTTDHNLLMDTLSARKDPSMRLTTLNKGFGQVATSGEKPMLTIYNSLFPLSNLLFGMAQMGHGKAVSEWITIDMDDGLNLKWVSEMAYPLLVDRQRALEKNIPLKELEKIRSYPKSIMPSASMMVAFTPTKADLSMMAEMADELFYPYIDGYMLEDALVISQAFARLIDYSWMWLDSPQDVLMQWMSSPHLMEVMDVVSLLTEEAVQIDEDRVWVDGYGVYITGFIDAQIVEIGSGIDGMTGSDPFYPLLEPVSAAFPQEWARIASREAGTALWAFIPGQLSLSGGFLTNGQFELNLHVDSQWLSNALAMGQSRNLLTSVVETYWYLYDVWDDMIWYGVPVDPEAFDQALEEYLYFYGHPPASLERFYWEYLPDQAGSGAELKVVYVGELPEGISADQLADQLYESRWWIPEDLSIEVVGQMVIMKMEASSADGQSWIDPMYPIVSAWWIAVDEVDRLFWWYDEADVTDEMLEKAFAESSFLDEEIWSWFSWDLTVEEAQYEVVLSYLGPIPEDSTNDLLRQALEEYNWYIPDYVRMYEEDGYLKMLLVYDRRQ